MFEIMTEQLQLSQNETHQYGFPSFSKNGTAAIGFLHGPEQTK